MEREKEGGKKEEEKIRKGRKKKANQLKKTLLFLTSEMHTFLGIPK